MVCQYCRYEGWEGDRCPRCGAPKKEPALQWDAGASTKDSAPAPAAPPPFLPGGTPRWSAPPTAPPQSGSYHVVPRYVLFHGGSTPTPYNPWTVPRAAGNYLPANQGIIPGGVPMVAPYRPGVPQYPYYYIPPPKKKLSRGKIALITAGGIAAGISLLLAVWLLVQDFVPKTLPGLRSPYVEMTWQGEREGRFCDKTPGGAHPYEMH